MNPTGTVKLTDISTIEVLGARDAVANNMWTLTRRNNGLWSGTGVGGNVTDLPTRTVFAMLKDTPVRINRFSR